MPNTRPLSSRLGVAALGAVLACGGCLGGASEGIAVGETLLVTDVTTGWLDVGRDQLGRNKLVPTVSFRIENRSETRTGILQVNGVFRRCLPAGQPAPEIQVSPADQAAGTCMAESQEWGSALIRVVGREGIPAGGAAGPLTMESGLGYTGEQALAEMLEHSDFVDAKVELFVKHRGAQWAKAGEHGIDRRLLAQ